MKRYPMLILLLSLALFLSACGGELPFEFDFSPNARPPAAPAIPVNTITPASSLTPVASATPTATFTPFPTQRSPYPVNPGTPLPDPGFTRINSSNALALKEVFLHTSSLRQASVASGNREKLLLGTSDGLYLSDIQGNQLAYWPEIRMADIVCDSCLGITENGSRFAVAVRKSGDWQIQVYDINERDLNLVETISETIAFELRPNPVQLAISRDGQYLAYRIGSNPVKIYNLYQKDDIFEYSGASSSLGFSRGGQYFYARRGQELLIWRMGKFEDGFRNLLLPDVNAAVEFSIGGESLAVASSSKIRIYSISPLRQTREIDIPAARGKQLSWLIAIEPNPSLIRGYALEWITGTQTGKTISGVWNISTGELISLEESETNAANIFDGFWNVQFPFRQVIDGLDSANIRAMRFTSADVLLFNSPNAACWFKLTTGESNCQTQEDESLYAIDGPVLREVRQERNTLLVNPLGETLFELGPQPIVWVSRSGDFLLLDNRGSTTDLYSTNSGLTQSVPGTFRSAAENIDLLAFLSKERNGRTHMIMVEKATNRALFKKEDTNQYDPLTMALDGTIYFLREDYDKKQAILRAIPAGTDNISDLLAIDLLAQPTALTVSAYNVVAIGRQDGSITIISLDSLVQQTFQGLQTSVTALAFSHDSHYLAVTGQDGITVFAVLP